MDHSSPAAPIDLVSRALLAMRDRSPHLSERMLLLQVQRDGSTEEENLFLPHVDYERKIKLQKKLKKQLRSTPMFSPLRTSGGGSGKRRRKRRSPARQEKLNIIETTSPYNPKLLLARALAASSSSRSNELDGGDGGLIHGTSQQSLLARQQQLIEQHGVGLWDRIVNTGMDPSEAMAREQMGRRRRAKAIALLGGMKQEGGGGDSGSGVRGQGGFSQLRGAELMTNMSEDLGLEMERRSRKSRGSRGRGEKIGRKKKSGHRPNTTTLPSSSSLNALSPTSAYNARPYTMANDNRRRAPSPLANGSSSSSPTATTPGGKNGPTRQQMHELSDRVRMLELEIAESKEVERHRKKRAKKKKKQMKKKKEAMREARKKTKFVKLAPFKQSATAAAVAVAGALAAAAAAEGLERSVSAMENLAINETGGNIPDDLALVLAKELDRAARRAAKTIDAASAAVSVTSMMSEAAMELAGKMVK